MGKVKKSREVSKNQRNVTTKPAVTPKPPKVVHATGSAVGKIAEGDGVYALPDGGTMTVAKGKSTYTGPPYGASPLKKKYLVAADDRDAQGKVRTSLGKR